VAGVSFFEKENQRQYASDYKHNGDEHHRHSSLIAFRATADARRTYHSIASTGYLLSFRATPP
jgi:hypothetical protein